ncbi:TetR/AcrR family transcriptional regulator [Streptomyces sp. NPDC059459]|uniref:TetR/AcrR family transcriptional regulator n=1 Tax=Streptomyces sp. NPDC059459 TaxID=3346839 RepID=UPI003678F850
MATHAEAPKGTPKPARRRRKSGSYTAADPRREKIIEAATAHVAQWGYLNSSMPKIAADAGISQAGLLHHFGNKQKLLSAVLEARENQAVERFYGTLDPDATDPLRLFQLMVDHATLTATQPELAQLYVILAAEACNEKHPAHTYFRDRYDRVIGFAERALRYGVSAGTLRPDLDCNAIAREIIAVNDGFQLQWGLSGGRWDMPGALRSHLDRLARTLTVNGQGLDDQQRTQ